MSQINPLSASLLKADSIAHGTLPENDRAELFRKVDLAERRQLRSRNIMYACWATLAVGYLLGNVLDNSLHLSSNIAFLADHWSAVVSVYVMLLWFTFFVTVQTIVRLGIVRGAQLNARLASIENLLAAMVQSRK